jgi:hypothetical protein
MVFTLACPASTWTEHSVGLSNLRYMRPSDYTVSCRLFGALLCVVPFPGPHCRRNRSTCLESNMCNITVHFGHDGFASHLIGPTCPTLKCGRVDSRVSSTCGGSGTDCQRKYFLNLTHHVRTVEIH